MLRWQGGETAKIVPFENAKPDSDSQSVWNILDTAGARMHFTRNAEIFGEGEQARNIYKVESGAVRTCKVTSDGRRQIGDFYLPGDPFGLAIDDLNDFSAEAIGNCAVRVIRRNALLGQAARKASAGAELWTQALLQLQRAQHHVLLLLGRKNAQERIAAFLIDMMDRLSRRGDLDLPMPRQDIADYLGLTIETVSRTLTQLERDGFIAISRRRIVFRDRAALDLMNNRIAA
jgi:CRP/FNR family nitrogen fixation transcriptional regulator